MKRLRWRSSPMPYARAFPVAAGKPGPTTLQPLGSYRASRLVFVSPPGRVRAVNRAGMFATLPTAARPIRWPRIGVLSTIYR